jgi:hypothetical protein
VEISAKRNIAVTGMGFAPRVGAFQAHSSAGPSEEAVLRTLVQPALLAERDCRGKVVPLRDAPPMWNTDEMVSFACHSASPRRARCHTDCGRSRVPRIHFETAAAPLLGALVSQPRCRRRGRSQPGSFNENLSPLARGEKGITGFWGVVTTGSGGHPRSSNRCAGDSRRRGRHFAA